MARVKRSVNARKERHEIFDSAKGYRGQRFRLYRKAKKQVLHSKTYEFRDRRYRKGQLHHLWIQRINAAARVNDIACNHFVQDLNLAGVEADRKNLIELAVDDPQTFATLIKVTKDAPPKGVNAPTAK